MVKMKKFLALALSATMMFSVAACGDKETNGTETQSTQTSESTVTTESEVVEEELTYPLNTDIKLTVWDQNFIKINDEYSSYKESPFHMGLEERTGVEINWTWPVAGADAGQAWNLLMTEKELPDIIFKSWSVSQAEQLMKDGAIYDLTEYLPKYAPDYWAAVNQPEYINSLKAFTTSDGKQFCVASFVEESTSITYMGPIVRKDWLDECGLDVPVTLADWDEMLVAFRDKYGVAPLAMRSTQLTSYDNFGSATGSYGSLKPVFYVEDGKVGFTCTTPEWKEYVAMMNRWWTDGLLDKDSVTMDNDAMRSKALNGEIGVAFVPMSQLTNYIADAEAEKTGAEWIPVGYPREAEGVPTSMIQTRAEHWSYVGAAISTALSEEELILALKWLNYGYTEEGGMYWNYGAEGESYTLDAEGKVQYTDLITKDPAGLTSAITKYTGTSANGMALLDTQAFLLKNDAIAVDAITVWTENTVGPEHCIPAVTFTEDENLIQKNLFAQINTYAKEMGMKFITGEESLDGFDAFVEKMNGMGLQQVINIRQAAYDRFMAK